MLEALRHVVHATGYSMAGLRLLLSETAARVEIAAALAALVWLIVLGASAGEILILILLFCILMSVEALNTAVEVIVDRISPDYTEFAKAAKDLASFAVFCLLAAGGLYVAAITAVKFGWIVLW